MVVRYAQSYIDALYEAKDMSTLQRVIDVVGRYRQLPEQFWLAKRIFAWSGWSRSGIWQYYEAISQEDFQAIATAMERFGLQELAKQYRSGMLTWKEPDCCKELDRWIDAHDDDISRKAFELIANDRHHLYSEN